MPSPLKRKGSPLKNSSPLEKELTQSLIDPESQQSDDDDRVIASTSIWQKAQHNIWYYLRSFTSYFSKNTAQDSQELTTSTSYIKGQPKASSSSSSSSDSDSDYQDTEALSKQSQRIIPVNMLPARLSGLQHLGLSITNFFRNQFSVAFLVSVIINLVASDIKKRDMSLQEYEDQSILFFALMPLGAFLAYQISRYLSATIAKSHELTAKEIEEALKKINPSKEAPSATINELLPDDIKHGTLIQRASGFPIEAAQISYLGIHIANMGLSWLGMKPSPFSFTAKILAGLITTTVYFKIRERFGLNIFDELIPPTQLIDGKRIIPDTKSAALLSLISAAKFAGLLSLLSLWTIGSGIQSRNSAVLMMIAGAFMDASFSFIQQKSGSMKLDTIYRIWDEIKDFGINTIIGEIFLRNIVEGVYSGVEYGHL